MGAYHPPGAVVAHALHGDRSDAHIRTLLSDFYNLFAKPHQGVDVERLELAAGCARALAPECSSIAATTDKILASPARFMTIDPR